MLVILVNLRQINFLHDIGRVKLGEVYMKESEIALARLEKHEAECSLRYQRLDEKLSEYAQVIKSVDSKLWTIGILVLLSPAVQFLWK